MLGLFPWIVLLWTGFIIGWVGNPSPYYYLNITHTCIQSKLCVTVLASVHKTDVALTSQNSKLQLLVFVWNRKFIELHQMKWISIVPWNAWH